MTTTWLPLSASRPELLWLLSLALLPWWLSMQRTSAWPSLVEWPRDRLSSAVDWGLRVLASLAFVAFALAAAGIARERDALERISHGAHIALVIDRSNSMNNTFAGQTPGGGEESKAAAARRLLTDFIARRAHDRVGVVAFSTSPIFVLPLTDHHDAVRAAIAAIDLPGLAYTDVARGLAMALSMFDDDALAERVVVLVSDGAAVIDRRVQERLRAEIARHPLRLYWLFLRTARDHGIHDVPTAAENDTPQELPERHLNLFFESLGIPYRAFEATDAGDVAQAIDEIDRAETAPLRYREAVPKQDLTDAMLILAALATVLLVLAKLAEVRVGMPGGQGA